ncbi:MAG: hypothetical protein WC073_10290, partial [Sterolibacterium sp.]
DAKAAGTTLKDTGAKLIALGYEHSLSKRTMLKVIYSRLANDDNVAYDYGLNAAGVNRTALNTTSGAGATDGLGTRITGVSVGVRHSF